MRDSLLWQCKRLRLEIYSNIKRTLMSRVQPTTGFVPLATGMCRSLRLARNRLPMRASARAPATAGTTAAMTDD